VARPWNFPPLRPLIYQTRAISMKRYRIWDKDVRAEVIAGVVLAVLGAAYTAALRWLPAIKTGVEQALSLAVRSSDVPNWMLLISMIALAGCITASAMLMWRWSSFGANRRLMTINYNEDVFFGIRWIWQYDGKARPVNFRPFCVTCGDKLYFETVTSYSNVDQIAYRCDRCGWHHSGISQTKAGLEADLAKLAKQRSQQTQAVSSV
jgi:hypothetical protein